MNWEMPSSDGIHTLKGVLFLPDGDKKGIFQVIHGMTDYTLRYESLLKRMAEAGYVSFGFDLLGHGHTAADLSELGFFGEKNGWKYLVEDVKNASQNVRECYGVDLPYYLLGHSMGSFVARCSVIDGLSPHKLILVGTAGKEIAAPFGIGLSRAISRIYGKKHVSFFLQGLVFGDYDRYFPEAHPGRWITVDTENLLRYRDDPFCKFRFSVSALEDLMHLHQRANSVKFYSSLPEDTQVLLLSGEDDPVGNWGKGVTTVYKALKKKGKRVQIHLYPGFRHEILQDHCKEEVMKEIQTFLEN